MGLVRGTRFRGTYAVNMLLPPKAMSQVLLGAQHHAGGVTKVLYNITCYYPLPSHIFSGLKWTRRITVPDRAKTWCYLIHVGTQSA